VTNLTDGRHTGTLTDEPDQGRSVGGVGGAEHPRAPGAAPVLKMARSTPS